jgi:hypothetical protein
MTWNAGPRPDMDGTACHISRVSQRDAVGQPCPGLAMAKRRRSRSSNLKHHMAPNEACAARVIAGLPSTHRRSEKTWPIEYSMVERPPRPPPSEGTLAGAAAHSERAQRQSAWAIGPSIEKASEALQAAGVFIATCTACSEAGCLNASSTSSRSILALQKRLPLLRRVRSSGLRTLRRAEMLHSADFALLRGSEVVGRTELRCCTQP